LNFIRRYLSACAPAFGDSFPLRFRFSSFFSFFWADAEKIKFKIENLGRASTDPAAAEDDVAVVEDGGLAGGDGALGRVEGDARSGGVQRLDGGRGGFVLMADFGEGAKRTGRLIAGNPVQGLQFRSLSFGGTSSSPTTTRFFGCINRENVERLAGGKAEALALADSEIVNAVVGGRSRRRFR